VKAGVIQAAKAKLGKKQMLGDEQGSEAETR
jgi:hypothetical protein